MDDTEFDESVAALMQGLPAPVRAFLVSPERKEIARQLTVKYFLHVDVAAIVEREMILMLLGVKSPDTFASTLGQAGLDSNAVEDITHDVNEMVFIPLQRKLREQTVAPRPIMGGSAPIARTAPAPANLPGAEYLLPASDPALRSILSTPPPAPLPVSVATPAPVQAQAVPASPRPMPQAAPAPMPAAMPAAPTTPAPRAEPALPSIYSVEPNKPAMPETKQGVSPQASVMWQTPVPPAWQGRQVQAAPAIPLMAEPPEKPMPRTMEGDMQLVAQRASQPQASQAPQPSFQPAAPVMPAAPQPSAPSSFVSQSSSYSTVHTPPAPVRPQESYVPPPRTVSAAPVRIGAGDPYREPIDAIDF